MGDVEEIKFLAYIKEPVATFFMNDTIIGFHGIPVTGNWSWKTEDLLLHFYKEVRSEFSFLKKWVNC